MGERAGSEHTEGQAWTLAFPLNYFRSKEQLLQGPVPSIFVSGECTQADPSPPRLAIWLKRIEQNLE